MKKPSYPTYNKVKSYMEKYPNLTLQQAADKTKSSLSSYYTQRKAALGGKKKTFEKFTPEISTATGEKRYVVIVTAEQLQNVLGVL